MFSEALNKSKELHSKIGSSFNNIFDEAVTKVTKAIKNDGTLSTTAETSKTVEAGKALSATKLLVNTSKGEKNANNSKKWNKC